MSTETVVYIGPSVSGLKTNTVLKGLDKIATDFIAKSPKAKRFFVKPEKVAVARREIKTGGSLASAYRELEKEIAS